MSRLRRRGIEVVVVLVAYIVASIIDAQDCTTSSCEPVAVWYAVLLALGLVVYEIVRMVRGRAASRPCPRCGRRVPVGVLDCAACEYDFRAVR
ncbi:MAG: hypothetical protein LC798_21790 [Chloroflexi bacterium]|nr:hypothetical protein [Chloroflexota bacterium]